MARGTPGLAGQTFKTLHKTRECLLNKHNTEPIYKPLVTSQLQTSLYRFTYQDACFYARIHTSYTESLASFSYAVTTAPETTAWSITPSDTTRLGRLTPSFHSLVTTGRHMPRCENCVARHKTHALINCHQKNRCGFQPRKWFNDTCCLQTQSSQEEHGTPPGVTIIESLGPRCLEQKAFQAKSQGSK